MTLRPSECQHARSRHERYGTYTQSKEKMQYGWMDGRKDGRSGVQTAPSRKKKREGGNMTHSEGFKPKTNRKKETWPPGHQRGIPNRACIPDIMPAKSFIIFQRSRLGSLLKSLFGIKYNCCGLDGFRQLSLFDLSLFDSVASLVSFSLNKPIIFYSD